MKRYPGILSAFAVLASVVCTSAYASPPACSAATLRGSYAFEAHGQVMGIISGGTVHAFTTPQLLNDVAILNFDGVNSFARTDFGMIAGLPKGGQTMFNPNQTGTYTVNSDCTGTMTISYTGSGAGIVLGLVMVISSDGTHVDAIITSETVPFAGPTVDGTTCGSSCQEGVQVALSGRKVANYGPHP
ncbi:hypothetical protein [Paraburkholderia phosphatilytica]|uniref:hypothetical protein n=1 Tax=Paraburkholderia phosphatilytica TaxID=2282883 RepID=UPI000E52E64E|nr:hypothetical protein [Paraburkholderia phosphatilytica]